jgi:Flp pilus assembly protein TadG
MILPWREEAARADAARTRARPGVAMVYFVVAAFALIGFISLAVDLGRIQLAKCELQAATDSAARYGVGGLATSVASVKSRCLAAAADNKVAGSALVLDQNNDIEFGTWNSTTKTFTVLTGSAQSSATSIRVTGRRAGSRGTAVPLFFAKVLGANSCDLSASCIASNNARSNDIFIVQDITTSFAAELPSAKAGLQSLLTQLYNGASPSRMAVSVHTGWGKTLAPLTMISSNYTYLQSKINSIQLAGSTGMPIASGTDISVGFDEAINAYTASGYVAPTGMKSVVLISDGQPSNDPDGKHGTSTASQLMTLAQTRANTLWSKNVHVYVIFMDTDNDAAASTYLKTLIRGNGDFVRVNSAAELPAAVSDLTSKLGGVLVVK